MAAFVFRQRLRQSPAGIGSVLKKHIEATSWNPLAYRLQLRDG
jgi:hypothetical protein